MGRRLCGLVAILFLLGTTSAYPKPIPVRVICETGYYPYSYAVSGIAAGIYVDILSVAFSRMEGYHVSIVPMPWSRGLLELKNGRAVALFPPYKRPVARPWMDYSEPILKERFSVIVTQEAVEKDKASWPDSFLGTRIGKNSGYVVCLGEEAEEAVKTGKLSIVETQTTKQNLLMLYSGRIQGYISEPLSAQAQWEALKANGRVRGRIKELFVLSWEFGYLGVSVQGYQSFPFQRDFMDKFNAIIVQMKESGEISRLYDDFLSREAGKGQARPLPTQ